MGAAWRKVGIPIRTGEVSFHLLQVWVVHACFLQGEEIDGPGSCGVLVCTKARAVPALKEEGVLIVLREKGVVARRKSD